MSTLAGIDIGSEAIKGVVLNFAKNGKAEVVAAGTLPISDLAHMEDSPDKTLALGVKLKELVKGARLHGATRRIGVSGKNTGIRYLQVPPVPPWRLDMLVKYEVEEKSAETEPTAYDYHILGVPEVGGLYTVMIGTCREATSKDLLQIGKAAGLGEVEIDLEALALYNAYYHGHGYDADKTVLIADIGADDMTVLLCRNGVLWFARTILGGGRRFSQVLAEELKIEFAEADELKKTQAEISFDLAPASTTRVGIPKRFGAGATGRGATGILPRTAERSGVIKLDPAGSAVSPASGDAEKPGAPKSLNPANSTLITLNKPGEGAVGSPTEVLDREQIKNALAGGKPPAPAAASADLPGSDDLFMMDMPPSLEALGVKSESTPPAPPAPAAGAPARPGSPIAPAAPAESLSLSDDTLLSIPSVDELTLAPMTGSAPAGTGSAAPGSAPAAAASIAIPADPQSDDKRKKQMSSALVREAAQLCAALENAVLFTKQQTKLRELKIDRVYLTGGGSKLKGLQEFMGRRMRMEVVPLEPLRQISLDKLPAEQAAALKNDQHTMPLALGLALSHRPGTFAFQLWPAVLEQKKIFWSRGAYLYYAAAMVAAAIGLFLFTPYRNAEALAANNETAKEAVAKAQEENAKIKALKTNYEEKDQRLKQIDENLLSGDKFLNILAELKSRQSKEQNGRISDDVYITSISTHIPKFLVTLYGNANNTAPKGPGAGMNSNAAAAAAAANNGPDTFQAQRLVYLRGFVLGVSKTELVMKIRDFYKNLVPHEKEPDNPDNLFKDICGIWTSRPEQVGSNYQMEFVLEAYVESTRDDTAPVTASNPRQGRGGRQRQSNPGTKKQVSE